MHVFERETERGREGVGERERDRESGRVRENPSICRRDYDFSHSDGWSLSPSRRSLWSLLPPHILLGIDADHQLGHTAGQLLHTEVVK